MFRLTTGINTTAIVLFLAGASGAAIADTRFTPACEEALALSALPERLRSDASVYVLADNGFSKTIEGAGNFTCIVERNHSDAVIPQCLDAVGAPVIIPAIMFKTRQALNGTDREQTARAFAARAAKGEFKPAAGPGISYMLSDYNYAYLNESAGIRKIPPHVMFYAPELSNDDIGGSLEAARKNRGQPFIVDPGIHGYMVSFVEHAASSDAVQKQCAGQLPGV